MIRAYIKDDMSIRTFIQLYFTVLVLISSSSSQVTQSCGDWYNSNNRINCTIYIIEQVPENTLVFDAPALAVGNPILYSSSVNDNDHFTVSDNRLYTSGSFDREEMVTRETASMSVVIGASVTAVALVNNLIVYKVMYLTIHVIDLNDNAPRFRRGLNFITSPYALLTHESSSLSSILTMEAVDYDEGNNGTSFIELVQSEPEMFNISVTYEGGRPTILDIVPIAALDREMQDNYVFDVIAYEGIPNPSNATLRINLTIGDENDNQPIFNQTQYSTSVIETSPINTSLIFLSASDPDAGTNAAISYKIKEVCAINTEDGPCIDIQPWPFALDTESGLLRVSEMLNYEEMVQYRLTVDAYNPHQELAGSSTALVNIEVLDVNDNAPVIDDFSVVVTLSENFAINSTYATFRVHDADSPKYSLFYLSLLDDMTGLNSTTFGLDSTSPPQYSVRLLQVLDRETRNSYNLTIMAQDLLNASLYSMHHFTISVGDVNDHSPVFNPVSNPVLLEEESSVSTLVVKVSATDMDIGTNAGIRYSLPPTSESYPYQGNFTIQGTTGNILVYTSIDRESTPTLFLLVVATDKNGANDGRSTNITINITLTDINDNPPIITTAIPSEPLGFLENITSGSLIIDIDATDPDVGSNAVITYQLSVISPSLSSPSPFVVNSSTGRVTVSGSLDYESVSQYVLSLSVTDGVNPPTTQNLTVVVFDVNDNSPTFPTNNYYKTLHENVTTGTPVITLKATDADSAQYTSISYSFVTGSSDFSINPTSGAIATAASLDWETQSIYYLIVRAYDGFGRYSENVNVTVSVVDVNDEIPKFVGDPYTFVIAEDAPPNSVVDHVTVKSIELGNNGLALFNITNEVPFTINGSGTILTSQSLNREVKDSYDVYVRVSDMAPPPHYNTTIVTIRISDVNDNAPQFPSSSDTVSVSEIHAVNSPFYTARATDADIEPNNVTKYYLAEGTTGFQINPDSGDLSLTTSLNYEVQQSILINIIARDNGNPNLFYANLALNITVLDDNNTNITFPATFPLQYSLSEDTALDFIISNFTGEDHKGNPKLHLDYYLTNITGGVPLEFGIEREASSGYALLSVIGALDRERQSTYDLNITISDGNTPPSTVTQFLTVFILDINDNSPIFSSPSYSTSWDEEQSGRQQIDSLSVSATDPDAGENSTIVYTLQDTVSGLFSIDSNGHIYQERALDRETKSNYSLIVMATDQGTPSRQSQASVFISVNDINDNSPTFSPTTARLDENSHVGTVVTTLVGSDPDAGSNGQVTFIYDTQTSNASSHFELYPNGTIIVTEIPDYEMNPHFIFFVTAQDGGSNPRKTLGNVTISLNDLNDNCPVFPAPASQYNISVFENASSGFLLIDIDARDLDQGPAGTVRYVFENIADSRQFRLDGDSGELSLNARLDYERITHHEVGILAYDQGQPRNRVCRQSIHVFVKNVNEFAPSFDDTPLFVFTVDEGLSSGAVVGRIVAHDQDSDSILSYNLSSSLQFTIDSTTGSITTLTELDYETSSFYNLTVGVTDQGGLSSYGYVLIFVGNVNDETPSFDSSTYTTSVSEIASNGTVFLTLTATDNDNHTNTPVTYSILGGNVGGVFGVEPKTGDIFVNGPLDYESDDDYVLSIKASDTGIPTRSATANVIITIINHNEFSPVFSNSSYHFNLTENSPSDTVVGSVSASDSDTGSYGNVYYSLQTLTSLFTISDTGVIRTLVPIDREAMPTLPALVVVASDSFKTQSVNVFINIVDLNDNRPYFPLSLYEFSIDNSSLPGTVIALLSAVDPDQSPVTLYSILNPPVDLPVVINSTTGSLSLSTTLTPVNSPYQFIVKAVDPFNSSFVAETTVRVYPTSSNDHYPNFTQPIYQTNISENVVPSDPIAFPMANDPDTGSNGLRRYSLQPNGSLIKDQFRIDELDGELFLTQALDYEVMTSHDITVYVRDSTPSHPRTATTHVIVTVTNENDNPPSFVDIPPSLTITYVPFTDIELFRLNATDPDGSPITYQLWTQTNKFSVDPVTGIVTNIIVLNNTVSYSLTFRVSDGNHTTSEAMTLNIISPGSSPLSPSFPNSDTIITRSVAETSSVGSLITTVTALNSPTSYHLVCCDNALSAFSLSSAGAFSVSDVLDYETQEEYQVIFEARRVSGAIRYSDYQQATVIIQNINEYTPTFNPVSNPIKVNENTGSNSLVVQVSATDHDSGSFGVISYQIISGNTDLESFSINSTNGAIRVANGKTLDHEAVPLYNLVVRASDGGGKQSTTMVNIMVLDVNDSPPVFPGNYTMSVFESGSVGERVLKVTAADADSSSTISYQLGTIHSYFNEMSRGMSNKFSLGSVTGELTLASLLDYETANRYEFTIKASDNHHIDTTHVVINVLDSNDNPPSFQQSTYFESGFIELSPPGTMIKQQIEATDTDSNRNSIIRYSLGQDWPTNKFTINEFSGVIRVKEPMAIDELESYVGGCSSSAWAFTGTVLASDGVWNTSVSLTVRFTDINKYAPIFEGSPYNIITSETTPIDTNLFTMNITDKDCGPNAAIITSFPAYYFYPDHLFNFRIITSNQLHVYSLNTKNTLSQGIYHFRLEAYNKNPSPADLLYYKASYAHVTVTVLPNNTHAPVFNDIEPLYIDENSLPETEVGYVSADDLDLGVSGLVHYWLNDTSIPFVIDNSTSLLKVNGSLDYEVKESYSFYVFAADNGYPVRQTSLLVVVNVRDRDDNPPLFVASQFNGSISENSPLESTVLGLNVTDADSTTSVTYSIINETSLPFSIDPRSGVLKTSGVIDYETQTEYMFSVMGASESTPLLNSTTLVKISVLSVNEYPPVLEIARDVIHVSRNASKGDVILTIKATDSDGGRDGVVSYSFRMSSPYLAVHNNGSITLNMSLTDIHAHHVLANPVHYRKRQSPANSSDIIVQLVVVATDGGNPPQSDTRNLTVIIPEGISTTSDPTTNASLTTEVIVIMSSVAAFLIMFILVTLICISTVFSRSRRLKKSKLDLGRSGRVCVTEIPAEEEDAANGGNVELQQIRAVESVTPTKTSSNSRLNKSLNDTALSEGGNNIYQVNPHRPSPHTRSTSDLASSIATDTLNLTQDAGFPYPKGQIEAIYAANVDLLHDGSQASVHTFGSEGGGESDGDEMDNVYYKYGEDVDVEGSMMEGEDDLSSIGGKDRNSMISESSDGAREDEYHFSQSTNPWSSRRSINDLIGEGSHSLIYGYPHSQGVGGAIPYGASTQGSHTSLLRGHRPHPQYRVGSERDLPQQLYSHSHRLGHPPPPMGSNYEYYPEHELHQAPPSLRPRMSSSQRYGSPLMEFRGRSSVPRGGPPPYFTQDPVQHSLTQSSTRGENYYATGFLEPFERQTLSTSSTSLSTSASHPNNYRHNGNGYH